MNIITIPLLKDNYGYLLIETLTKNCLAIDPVQPQSFLSHLKNLNLSLAGILTTHHHYDHSGGNMEFLKLYPNIPVYGADERIPGLSYKLLQDSSISFGSLKINPIFTPCHTSGSISYHVNDGSSDAVFTGDTLFMAGCGRFFEGTAEDMVNSLEKLAALPADTKVYCGHEYTLKNLEFASTVEPENLDISRMLEYAKITAQTIPSTIEQEFKINPFMRVLKMEISFQEKIQMMKKLRSLKDNF